MGRKYKLLIKPVEGKEEVVKGYYTNHSTFHEGDSGLDIYCLEDTLIPAKTRVKVKAGIECEMVCNKYKTYLYNSDGEEGEESEENDYTTRRSLSPVCKRLYKTTNVSYKLYPRSSICNTPLILSNSTGIIDAGYRGEIGVCFDNIYETDFTFKKGDRIAQICLPILKPFNIEVVDKLSTSSRGKGGFGSTGK